MATGGPKAIITHSQRVCRLYKAALKLKYNHVQWRHQYRYECVLLRARFEESRNEKDMRKCAAMVEAGEEEVFQNQAVSPFIYRNDEHGITFNRQAHLEDHLLNEWHPWEKANYIDYFKKREELAEEMQSYWDNSLSKKFANPPKDEYPIISPGVAALK